MKVILITGASSGMGYETAKILAQKGHKVYGAARRVEKIEPLGEFGVTAIRMDITDEQSIVDAVKTIIEKEGRIDVVVNTAGVLVKEALTSMSPETIQNSINVNLLGVINVAREAFPYLRETRGSLLFYTSSSYTRGRMMYSLYSATKAAIVNFVQAISEEWHDFGIRVNCINPERTKTPMRIQNFGHEPEGSLLAAEDVAIASFNTVFSNATGEVIDVRRQK